MEEYQLRRMVERRGYTLEAPTMAHLTTFDVLRGEDHIMQISVYELERLTAGAIPPGLDHAASTHHTMQYHMCCLNCHAPLLSHLNTEPSLKVYQNAPPCPLMSDYHEYLELLRETADAASITEYRDAKQGPASEPLKNCPVCLLPLDEKNVVGIVDTEIPAIKAAFDFEHAMHQIQLMSGPNAEEAEEIQRKLLEWARQEE